MHHPRQYRSAAQLFHSPSILFIAKTSEQINWSDSLGISLVSELEAYLESLGVWRERSDLDNLVTNREVDQFAIRVQIERSHDTGAMCLDRFHADIESCRRFFVASSLRE